MSDLTREEAISILERLCNPEPWEPKLSKEADKALDMAISALSTPSANVISIDQANAMIKSYVSHYEENKGGSGFLFPRDCPKKERTFYSATLITISCSAIT